MAKKRIMVCVTAQRSCERLIVAGDSKRGSDTDEVYLVHVMPGDDIKDDRKNAEALDYLFEIAGDYGAVVQVFAKGDFVEKLAVFAIENKIDVIVIGESSDKKRQKNTVYRLKKRIERDIEIMIIPIDD